MRGAVTLLTAGVLVAGCAGLSVRNEQSNTDHMKAALSALEQQQILVAFDQLLAVVYTQPGGSLERHARLLAAALAIDPRNPARDPKLGAELLTSFRKSERDGWETSLAHTLFALALDLGAVPDPTLTEGAPLAPLPAITAQPMAVRLRELEATVAQLQEELKRIRETLKP
jgi:hypothetical protein